MNQDVDLPAAQRLERLERQLEAALDALEAAPAYAKARYQTELYRVAADLLDSDAGLRILSAAAHRFDAAGVFHGGPWADPRKLLADLVGGGLRADGVYPTLESLSELRMIALVDGRASFEGYSADEARSFLEEVCAKNLDLVLRRETEESRARSKIFERAWRLFDHVAEHVPLSELRKSVTEEVEALCAQRPIMMDRIRELVERGLELPKDTSVLEDPLEFHARAMGGATEMSRAAPGLSAYRQRLVAGRPEQLLEECRSFTESLRRTGLASPYHAVALRRVSKRIPEELGNALCFGAAGMASVAEHLDMVRSLVTLGIHPHTSGAILGLIGTIERKLLSRTEVAGGLRRIMDLDIRPDVGNLLLSPYPEDAGLTANNVLLAGTLSVLGQPLGIGQGNNPTCQSARGISLWSLHGPGLLLGMIARAARDGFVECDFEGQMLRSDQLAPGLVAESEDFDPGLDPVSRLLVPHLDRLYARMMALTALRGEDGHKWVNPALYGRWVATGFASAIDATGSVVRHHQAFVRLFFASHHPEYNDGHELIYPNPVGLMVTDVHGRLLGPHAVSLQRIGADPQGELRIYFFNPNNEGRQDWGDGVRPSVAGHGEVPGESSLPFDQLVSRLYAFQYDPHETGEAYAVDAERVREVSRMARESWGRALQWLDA